VNRPCLDAETEEELWSACASLMRQVRNVEVARLKVCYTQSRHFTREDYEVTLRRRAAYSNLKEPSGNLATNASALLLGC
jgi:hypothetical protein